jgi:hypothetical protein
MKARKLKKILNNTEYTVAFYGEYIGIGSLLCHDLIKLDVSTSNIKYALDTWRKGRESVLHHKELTFIWDKLTELVGSGEINDIINGNDIIDNPLPVYTIRDGQLLCTVTDAYGWPNTTVEGYMMHDNTYFKTISEAVEYGINEYKYRVCNLSERLIELQKECSRFELMIQDGNNVINGLKLVNQPTGGALNMQDPNVKTEPANQDAIKEQAEQATEATPVVDSEEGTTEG